jgi:flagellar L-ring protein precursor FlgH
MISVSVTRNITCLLAVLLLTACATPKRGDPEFAPAMPQYVPKQDESSDSIYQSGTTWLLLEDLKARRIGDMLTVVLEEQTDAEKKAETDAAKKTGVDISGTTLLGEDLSLNGKTIVTDLQSDYSFDGGGESTQSNSLTGSVTVTVVDVQVNGNLSVQGEKWIHINQGEEYVRLRGIVRPTDISPDNTISSVRVANAQIQYSGDSTLNDSNEMGWLTKFFNSKWMPF